jgi:hypothetical protein
MQTKAQIIVCWREHMLSGVWVFLSVSSVLVCVSETVRFISL